jgi:pimeloyl-ACP methyl ester carboxylesterase/DNA-binding Lrp family transcriptional regulator
LAELSPIWMPRGRVSRHVIFVHGLNGDPRTTWMGESLLPPEERLWPRWLGADIEGLGVWSVGYEAPLSEWRGLVMDLAERASNVLSLLETEDGLAEGDLIFIGHSLGGLVIKQMLRKASDASSRRAEAFSLIERTRKVAFLATPHLGADLAGWGDRFRVFVRPSAPTRALLRNDPHLHDLNIWYRGWANEKKVQHLILYETKNTSFFGKLVKPDSSDPGLLSDPVPVDADHIGIAKPSNRDNEIYQKVLAFIEREATRPVTEVEKNIVAVREQQHVDSAKLDELLKLARQSGVVELAHHQGISELAVRNIVNRLGGEGIEREGLIPWLENWMEATVRELGRRSNEDEAFEAARQEAERRFKAGFNNASSALMEEFEREAFDEQERQEERKRRRLRILQEAIRVDELALDAAAIVEKLRQLAGVEGREGSDEVGAYLFARADEYRERGLLKGDNSALLFAIAAFRETLKLYTQERAPLDWAKTQHSLGMALAELGSREIGTARREEAVVAYRAALTERTQERVPSEWASTQTALGAALMDLGGAVSLEEAIAAFRSALEVRKQERFPLQWGTTRSLLGNALLSLAKREGGTIWLEKAIAAYREALAERTKERDPLGWASTKFNLGNALQMLAEHEGGTALLEEAVAAYREALTERTRERVPLQWAMTQNSLGIAFSKLARHESGTARLEEAVAAYREALTERTKERVPLEWASTKYSLGYALQWLAKYENGTARLEEAVATYREALTEYTQENEPRQWAALKYNLGGVFSELARREGGTARLEEAVAAYREALAERTKERDPLGWARLQDNLNAALTELEKRKSETGPLV